MIYKFVIVSDEADNFKLQIAIDSTATFMQLRNTILESTFVFDYMTERFFKVKLKQVIPGKSLHDPLCESKIGTPPAEDVDIVDFITIPKIPDASNIDAIDKSEFYGDEEYDEDEISDFEEMDNLDTDSYNF